jgi:mRNA interferase MazF
MAIDYHPSLGEALWCDYTGIEPEMIKRRLAVVIVPKACSRKGLTTVVPISTSPPEVIQPWHVRLERDPYPKGKKGAEIWAKCDMFSVVSFQRLWGYYTRWNGRRQYQKMSVSLADIQAIRQGVLNALGHPW